MDIFEALNEADRHSKSKSRQSLSARILAAAVRRLLTPIEELEMNEARRTAEGCVDKCKKYFGDTACTGDYAAQHIAEDIRKEYLL